MNVVRAPGTRRTYLLYAGIFLLGGAFFFIIHTLDSHLTVCNRKYNLLSPAFCKSPIQQGEWDYEPLRMTLTQRKNELKAQGTVSHISIYFRDLEHGPRFSIGDYEDFQPASLLKLPVLIAYLHEADKNPALLDETLSFTGSLQTNKNVQEDSVVEQTIEPNVQYSVRDLLTKMIVYSDNYSTVLLVNTMNSRPRLTAYNTFHDLNVLTMMLAPNADYISISSYATLFAVLYNTGYLSKDMSQFALELLSKTSFTQGLVRGVPDGVVVAHKYGQRMLPDGERQLHDCGIVYHESAPYILCIMTSGSNFALEEDTIAEFSKTVYDSVTELYQTRGQ